MGQQRQNSRKRPPKNRQALDLQAGPPTAPGDERSGTIEQHLDMYESGPLRGDEILHHHGLPDRHSERRPLDKSDLEENFHVDMAEDEREGDEESGDEHSSGMQGTDPPEPHEDASSPGEMTERLAYLDPTLKGYRRRAG